MSKAFVNEENETYEINVPRLNLIGGAENHMTSGGVARLRAELSELEPSGDVIDESRRQLLRQMIDTAHVIVPEEQHGDRVVFGATVGVRDEDGKFKTYKLVGVDESDAKAGKVSWISPIGKALIGARVGDVVTFKMPKGEEDLEVESVEFLPID